MIKMMYLYVIMLMSVQMLSGMNAARLYPNTTSWIANIFRIGFYSGIVKQQLKKDSDITRNSIATVQEAPQNSSDLRKKREQLYQDKRHLEKVLRTIPLPYNAVASMHTDLENINKQINIIEKTTPTLRRSGLSSQGVELYKNKQTLENTLKIHDLSTPVKANLQRELRRIDLQLKSIKS